MTSPFGLPGFDPSNMDPKVLMQLSQLIQQLPPEQLNQMQSLMHNAMAGHDVRFQMEEFERNLPPGFRDKLTSLVAGQVGMGATAGAPPSVATIQPMAAETSATSANMDLHAARITILRAVGDGRMTPEDAEKLLFTA
jgi:hypothetical protein